MDGETADDRHDAKAMLLELQELGTTEVLLR
jgi:hypothetical protein